jgi:hypothetical protein
MRLKIPNTGYFLWNIEILCIYMVGTIEDGQKKETKGQDIMMREDGWKIKRQFCNLWGFFEYD